MGCGFDISWSNSCFLMVVKVDLRYVSVTFPGQLLLPLGAMDDLRYVSVTFPGQLLLPLGAGG